MHGNNDVMGPTRVVAIVALSAAVAGLGGCNSKDDTASDLPRPSRAFCAAAARYDEQVTTGTLGMQDQIRLVAKIADTAPKDIVKDARTFLDALRRRADGDVSVIDNPRIKTAADNVLRRAGQDCGWYRRREGV